MQGTHIKFMKKFITKHNKELLVTAAVLIYAGLFIFFYPPVYTIMDEASYFDFAYNLKQGKIIYENPMQAHFVMDMGKGYVNQYPIGLSLLLLPLTFISWKALFLLNPILHILAFVFFYKLLKRYNINTNLSILYLFYPGFVLYSRTLVSDMASASIFIIGLYFYLRNSKRGLFISGFILGYLCLIKYSNVIIAGVLFLILLYSSIKSKNLKFFYLLYGLLPFAIFIMWYNLTYYGGIFTTPYQFIGTKFELKHIIKNLPVYIASLAIIYPLMVISPFIGKKYKPLRWVSAATFTIFLVFISSHYFHQGIGAVQQPGIKGIIRYLITSQRLTLPIIPLCILSYTIGLDKFAKSRNFKSLIALFVLFVFTGNIYMSSVHQKYLLQNNDIRNAIYKNTEQGSFIICDTEANKFLQKIWGERERLDIYSSNINNFIKSKKCYLFTFAREDKPNNAKRIQNRKNRVLQSYSHSLVCSKKGFLGLEIYRIK